MVAVKHPVESVATPPQRTVERERWQKILFRHTYRRRISCKVGLSLGYVRPAAQHVGRNVNRDYLLIGRHHV